MADEAMQAGISIEWIETDEEPFRPEATTEIFATLTPLEAEQDTFYPDSYSDFFNDYVLPPYTSYTSLPKFSAPQKELIINIETTTANPWEGRIICIGVLDPNVSEPQALNFIQETEQDTINEFVDWYEAQGFEELVGYNVGFDYRFLYVVCQKYRRQAPNFMQAALYDLMNQQEQVKAAFVPGYRQSGSLEDWATYLFGMAPYAPQEKVWEWFEQGNVDEIVNYNSDKLVKSYFLFVVDKLVKGEIPGMEVLSRQSEPFNETPTGSPIVQPGQEQEMLKVTCPVCQQVQNMPKGAKVINCWVCKTPIANPSLS